MSHRRHTSLLRSARAALLVLGLAGPGQAAVPADPPSLQEPDDRLAAGWADYRARFVLPEGRVVDDANGGISHSEGQGYGLVLAAMAGDAPTFERIWRWTRAELMDGGTHLAAWRWDPGHTPNVADGNNATDGDLLIAWGLSEGAERFHRPDFRRQAGQMARQIGRLLIAPSPYGPVLKPGRTGFDAGQRADGPVVNLSYWVFPALEACRRLAPEFDWDGVRQSGLALIARSRFGLVRLPADWTSLAGQEPVLAAGFKPTFSYDAIRIPLYLAWSAPDQAEDRIRQLAPFATLWSQDGDLGPFEIDLRDASAGAPLSGQGFKTVAALARCLSRGAPIPPTLLHSPTDPYYPSTLQLLATTLVTQRYPQCL